MTDKNHVTIEASTRTGTGKTYTRKLRRAGKIPAVLNTQGKSTVLELDPKMLSRAWRDNGKKFDLLFNGQTQPVTITELQIHPVSRAALHVELAPAK